MPLYKATVRYSGVIDGVRIVFDAGDVLDLDGVTVGRISRDLGRKILERVPAGTQRDPRPEPAPAAPTRLRPPKPVYRPYTVQHAYRAGRGREGTSPGPDWTAGQVVELDDAEAAYRERDSPGLLDPTPAQPDPGPSFDDLTAGQRFELRPPPFGGANPLGAHSTTGH